MINYISGWAGQIITCVIVVTILEMILPNGNSKKYIKTIIGVYVLYTIISPVIKLVNGGELKIDYSKYEKYFESAQTGANINAVTVKDTYKDEIEKKMKSDVENMGFDVNKISVEFDLENGIITKAILSVKKSKEEKNENNIDISINKIDIGGNVGEENISIEEIQKIKQMINEDYGVDMTNITINSM